MQIEQHSELFPKRFHIQSNEIENNMYYEETTELGFVIDRLNTSASLYSIAPCLRPGSKAFTGENSLLVVFLKV